MQWAGLIVGQPCRALSFYRKAEEQALLYNKIPMLIAKQNRLPIMVMMPTYAAEDIGINTQFYPMYRQVSIFPFSLLLEVSYSNGRTPRPRLRKKEEGNA